MLGSRLNRRNIGLVSSLAVGAATIAFAYSLASQPAEPQAPLEPAIAAQTKLLDAEAPQSESDLAVAAPTGSEIAFKQSGSTPAADQGTQTEDVPADAPVNTGKGPGLASPPPSPLQTAASAVAAKNAGRTVKIGIQAGHWRSAELPAELASLRTSTGAAGSGWREVDVNLEMSQRIADILAPFGFQVDLLPATVPVGYKADAFVSIHGDANSKKNISGFKIARATKSAIPEKDDALVRAITDTYKDASGLSWHAGTITQNMLQYYAFNRKLKHSVDAGTPSVIVELGFFSNPSELEMIQTQSGELAESIALGILNFLSK